MQEPLHVPEHVNLHPPEQVLEHDPAHPPEQLYLQPIGLSSLAATIEGTFANMIAPKIGNAPLAAFLKNSLRDWSLSFFLIFFITLRSLRAS